MELAAGVFVVVLVGTALARTLADARAAVAAATGATAGAAGETGAARGPAAGGRAPALSVLKPVRGADDFTEAALASWCEQDYDGPIQVLFCLQDEADPALPIARRVADRTRQEVRVGPVAAGWSGKMSNLRHGLAAARHDTLVLSDGDIRAAPDTCARIAGALAEADLVSCLPLFTGARGLWARLYEGLWTYVILGFVAPTIRWRGRGAIGGTLALRRETLERLGGLEPFRDFVAEDVAIGRRAAELGLRARLGPAVDAPVGRLGARDLAGRFARAALLGDTLSPVEANLRFAALFAWLPVLLAGAILASGPLLASAAALLALRVGAAAGLARISSQPPRLPWEAPLGDL
ncbi:MAG: glycosyltransferase, partial [Gemmatimonadota bacterium]